MPPDKENRAPVGRDAVEKLTDGLAAKSDAEHSFYRDREQAVDVCREWTAAKANSRTDDVLSRHRVAPDVATLCGLSTIECHGPFYEPSPTGAPAIIVPVHEFRELTDLVAFDPKEPTRWHVRLGAAPLLGIDNMATDFGPLHVWRHPLNFLRAGLEGVVISSWACARPLLACCTELIAEDVAHGREIRAKLSRPPALPKISVPVKG